MGKIIRTFHFCHHVSPKFWEEVHLKCILKFGKMLTCLKKLINLCPSVVPKWFKVLIRIHSIFQNTTKRSRWETRRKITGGDIKRSQEWSQNKNADHTICYSCNRWASNCSVSILETKRKEMFDWLYYSEFVRLKTNPSLRRCTIHFDTTARVIFLLGLSLMSTLCNATASSVWIPGIQLCLLLCFSM